MLFAKRYLCFMLFSSILWAAGLPAVSAEDESDCLIFGTAFVTERTRSVPENVWRLFNANIGCTKIFELNPKRMHVLLNNGRIDGEVRRIHSYHKLVEKSAIRINVPITHSVGLLVTREKGIKKVSDLKGKTIAYIRGYKWQEDALKNHDKKVPAIQMLNMIKMFEYKRVDAVLVDKYSMDLYAESFKEKQSELTVIDYSTYIYIHKRHKALVPKIEKMITDYLKAGHSFLDMPADGILFLEK